jgi:alanine racemase
MSLRLTVRRDAYLAHLRRTVEATPHLVPVVKGNGYGLGRDTLMGLVDELLGPDCKVAVGTIHELAEVGASHPVQIMTPLGDLDRSFSLPATAIPTVASTRDLAVLHDLGWRGHVTVKLASSMRRFGVSHDEFAALVQEISLAGCLIDSCSIHLPTAGSEAEHLAELRTWIPSIPRCVTVSASHISPSTAAQLTGEDPERVIETRLGTQLWHGTKEHFDLHAEVLAVHRCSAGETAGYRATTVPGDGHLVVIAAGTAQGVSPLPNGDSPFHFVRTRLTLVEPPYMHSALAFVPEGQTCPTVGDVVDVQRPLTMVHADIVEWL